MVELLAGFRQENRTIVITTHQRELAAPIADWVLRLASGQRGSHSSRGAQRYEDQRRTVSRKPRHSV